MLSELTAVLLLTAVLGSQGSLGKTAGVEESNLSRCPTLPRLCFQPPVRGLCRAYFRRYYFDSNIGKCKLFIYGGCGGNRNNFRDKKSCEQKCPAICPGGGPNTEPTSATTAGPTPAATTAPTRPRPRICPAILLRRCTLPPVKGPCRARKRRFYYDQQSNTCKVFFYGGCRGNRNNFKTRKSCKQNCPNKCVGRTRPYRRRKPIRIRRPGGSLRRRDRRRFRSRRQRRQRRLRRRGDTLP